MLKIDSFTFNPFQENTYVLSDESGECIIIDPGCYDAEEKEELAIFIDSKGLKPVKILLTHAHIDHVLGINFLAGKYGLPIVMNSIETELLKSASIYGQMWGIQVEPAPDPQEFLKDGDTFTFGKTELEVLFTPGHSPGSLSFYHRPTKQLIAGDVLFYGSIGRTDLPGGNFETLEKSIRTKLYTLEDDVIVYSGHGQSTTIGHEKRTNPFVNFV
ncbi:MAG TPA: MBL fold metallo-hydrolase [Bacteroidia bacterium]|jgi:glyoxylase-like metal-dependent hydrolase (beta-lactamase superfamily II)|nr:MBL fold metallo-hydrolase [Bacteroidota bacterium]MBP9789144.1 MBL fold metallo-hydrolase [Bacteroidia bacterium]MBK7430646.1 MBL fold metallo-hydrolase [Bacteroidota bacterium]MBK8585208.1 MBL fold metallo-hydrolase [Bacteroidota bacterium]MBP9923035.1 MBL fold metallo-hydrolase [Bacteroidia bacterium]